ncbi:hypothetical protein Dda_2105 [Drechslerella dactyloides]|uniref:GAT domain-containing protein n=1 Tax=Drechslerella dactyloides TaxID=74499 RepID=A0AAD6J3T2_DREDA|nr:hypothetical protein Dda_2105 [Drechslerella dactyloides]
MKKFQDLIRPKAARSESQDTGADTPEANVARAIKAFFDAGKEARPTAPGPEGIDNNAAAQGGIDEVTFLPTIVDCTESSPTAAKEALVTIRKNLEHKGSKNGAQQYKALMLFRILTDNPGAQFTRNIDAKFVSTVKDLYRGTRDPSVRQLLVENMEYCLTKEDPGLQLLKEWYVKEKESAIRAYAQVTPSARGALGMYSGLATPPLPPGYHHTRRAKNALPTPEELAQRIAEAQTSAKLLMQILQSTPTSEILANQLITEFADRCSAASRSIQLFIEADSPPPDESTMLTLFETNEQLATSLSRHQLAVFSAKQAQKQEGASRTNSSNAVPQVPQPQPTPSPQPEGPTGAHPDPEPQQPVVSSTPNYGFSGFGNRASPSPPVVERPYPPPPQQYPSVGQGQQYPSVGQQYPSVGQGQQYPTSSQIYSSPGQQNPDNPFNDPEPVGGYPWRQQQQQQQQQQQPRQEQQDSLYDRYSPSPVDHTPPAAPGQERHPMADATPAPVPPMPHGYQPYRY